MRIHAKKVSVLAVAAVAASLSLTACNSNGGVSASASGSSNASGAAGSAGSAGTNAAPAGSSNGNGNGSGSGSGSGAAAGNGGGGSAPAGSGQANAGICHTAQLGFSHSWGMGEGELLINLKNTSSGSCEMRGFPGVDLVGADGTVSAGRSSMAAPDVVLQPGQETNFVLHFPPNNTGGSGVTFTKLVVTPPNETNSHTMPVGINVPADGNASPKVYVDPVGAGK
ncbi:DUF4232 domain-containing protein [Phaeacidiphilus oryzae]|uniref:DUF4232 domain-containing protein n=1 Tax=Phaeacidiphilus oryzae TaxID=348818 RepID=UPI00055E7EE1|nr:DUF4232 domain-containing protein [Phaeacidiphilus oryzae]